MQDFASAIGITLAGTVISVVLLLVLFNRLSRIEKHMADSQADLDAALAAQTSAINSAQTAFAAGLNQVAADLQAVIIRLGAIGAPTDLTAEVTQIQANTAALATNAAQASAAVTADNTATQAAIGSIPVVPNPAPVTPAT